MKSPPGSSDFISSILLLSASIIILFVSKTWSFLEIRPFLNPKTPDTPTTTQPVWNLTFTTHPRTSTVTTTPITITTSTTSTTNTTRATTSTRKKTTPQVTYFKNWTSTQIPVLESKYNYDEILLKSIWFYEAQRSGRLPEQRHLDWRHDSALNDRGNFGEDLTGGWYDAGDHMKFGFTMAGATTLLLWSLVEFREAYERNGLLKDMLDCVKWPLEYFLKAHTMKYEFYAQVGDPYIDHSYWTRPEDLAQYRPAFRLTKEKPGSDVIAETAAALAAGAIVFNRTDSRYSALLLHHAMELFDFANQYRGKYSDSIPGVSEFYPSSGYKDELVWASAWLYRATSMDKYLAFAEKNYLTSWAWSFSWDEKEIGAVALLYTLTRKAKFKSDITRILNDWLPGGNLPYTPKGLVYRSSWGVLRYAGNMALVALIVAKAGIKPAIYHHWAQQQIHYILGDSGRSYVVGFGKSPPTRPHHSGSSCQRGEKCSWDDFQNPGPNPIILYGALVGGPDINDHFVDDRADFVHNEVTCDYNAGFHSAVAGLRYFSLQRK